MVKNRYNSIYKRYQSRSQRASAKKIIDRILDDLQKRISPPTLAPASLEAEPTFIVKM